LYFKHFLLKTILFDAIKLFLNAIKNFLLKISKKWAIIFNYADFLGNGTSIENGLKKHLD